MFALLAVKIIPLYGNLILGFIAGKWLKVSRESIAALVIYMVAPIVFFGGIAKGDLSPILLLTPFVSYLHSTIIGLVSFWVAKRFYRDSRPNIIAQASGTGNNGYFGLPIAMALFDANTVSVYLLLVIGTSLYESTIGFFLTARGQHTVSESLRKTLRLPVLYAFLLGSFISLNHIALPAVLFEMINSFRGAYVVLGMMMIGLALSGMTRLSLDTGFTLLLFIARFVAWPMLAISLIWLDNHFLHLYGNDLHRALLLFSFMPLAANSVAIASLLRCHPEKTATTVLLSTIFALFYIPYMVQWLM